MSRWVVTNPWIFFGAGGAVVAYLLFMMVRRRKGERDLSEHEIDL
jgi:hypothetical protein